MNKSISLKYQTLKYLTFSLPFLIFLFLVFLPKSSAFLKAPNSVSTGILLDLLLTIPLLYFLIIRKTKIPKFTTVYVVLFGIIAAGFIIPPAQQDLLSKVKNFAIPVLELGIISIIIYKLFALKSSFNEVKSTDFYDRLLIACQEIFPNRIGKLLSTEIAVFYYLFAPNKKTTQKEFEFTYFKKSGIKSIIGALVFILIIETVVLHFVLEEWNTKIAWLLTILGTYAIIQIVSILRSMNKRLISFDFENESLELRYGFGSQTSIAFESIDKIDRSRKSKSNDKDNISLSLFDLVDSKNITLYLKEEHTLHKIYGIEKKYKSISFFIDDINLFIDHLDKIMEKE